ncbi:MAG TPA: hypothetical protein VI756_05940 [Blastocatellia bacterium]
MKVTVCSLARELRLNPKRIIAEARGVGLHAARSTDRIPNGIARRIRAKYRQPRGSANPAYMVPETTPTPKPESPLRNLRGSSRLPGEGPPKPVSRRASAQPIEHGRSARNIASPGNIVRITNVAGFARPLASNRVARKEAVKPEGLTTDEIEFLLSILSPPRRKAGGKHSPKASA